MESIWSLGIVIVLFLQSLGTWLVTPMKIFTFLGNEQFFLLIAPAILWCLDYTLGLRLGLGLMITSSLNSLFKLVFHGPRPYWYDSRLTGYSSESSFGVPSGHSQSAVTVWGMMAAWFKRAWAWIVAILLILMIGISRMYLGVHFPHDVLLGWLLGALVLWGFLSWERPIVVWLGKKKPQDQVVVALVASLVIILLGILARLALGKWIIPQEWITSALKVNPAEPINPLSLSGLVSNAGAFFGLALGAILLKLRDGFSARGSAIQLLARFLIGLAGVVILWYGLDKVFPDGETLIPFFFRYLRYGLVGLWITGLAPMVFIRFKLATNVTVVQSDAIQ